jgi:hypothetical protein
LTNICTATKRDGSPCTLPSNAITGLCWAYDPANAERRRRGQSRGGRNKPSREIQDIKSRLSQLAEDVLEGTVEKSTGAVVSQVLNTYIRALDIELKAIEQLQIVARIELLEEENKARRNRTWGA